MNNQQKYLVLSILTLLLTAFVFNRFLDWHEHRDGIYFNDPVFRLFKSVDCSVLTFTVLYGAIVSFIFIHIKDLKSLSLLAYSYILVLYLRIICLWILPFYADHDAIKLNDPFLNTFIYPGNYVARDLFFSGHVAILVLLVLIEKGKWKKTAFALATLIVGFTVVLQKVHFSIDVLAAPAFAYIGYRLAKSFIIRN